MKRLKWIGLISLLPIGALVIFLAFMAYQETIASSELNRKFEAMREAGEPFDNDSLAVYFEKHSHQDGTNAWSEVLALSQASQDLPFANDWSIMGGGVLPKDLRPGSEWPDEPHVAEYLKEVRPIIKGVLQADKYPKPVWMPMHFDGYATLLQPCQDSGLPISVLALDSVHALYHKEGERALQDIVAMRSVADAFDWPFFTVVQYITMAKHSHQWRCINRSLQFDVWNEEQLAALSVEVGKRYDTVKAWKAGYAGDMAMFNASLANIPNSLPTDQRENPLFRLPMMPSTRLEVLRAFEESMHCADQGEEGLIERAKATFESQMNRHGMSLTKMYLAMFLPAGASHAEAFARQEDHRRMTLTSLAVKRFQLKKKRWPKTLSELTEIGLASADWTTKKRESFGYEVEGDEAFVWSYEQSKGTSVSKSRPDPQPSEGDESLHVLVSIR